MNLDQFGPVGAVVLTILVSVWIIRRDRANNDNQRDAAASKAFEAITVQFTAQSAELATLRAELNTLRAAVDAAHDPTKRERDEKTAKDAAKAAYAGLNTYLNTNNPTNAQTVAALKAAIRVALGLDEPPDGRE